MTTEREMQNETIDLPEGATRLAVRTDHYCCGCGGENPHGLKLVFYAEPDETVWAYWTPTRENEGFTGMAHGGIITTVLDEVMGWATYDLKIWAVTGKLDVSFRRPVEIGVRCRALARVTNVQGRKLTLHAELRRDGDDQLLAEADGMFIRVPEERAREWEARYYDPDKPSIT
jgi:acyl-coenzyme A thioesterase PaaI-like protein